MEIDDRPMHQRPIERSLVRSMPLLIALAMTGCARTAADVPVPTAPREDLERVIDEMLAEEGRALSARSKSAPGEAPPVAMPEVSNDDIFPATRVVPEKPADTFDADVLRIQETVPTWNNGTGIALRFLRETSGKSVSLVYVDPTPPEYQEERKSWVIQATAKTARETLGHFVLLLADLAPGRYLGSANEEGVVMSTSMDAEWSPLDPETTWSINDDSWCELVLQVGSEPSTLEGHFRAKLFDNQGTGFHRIESGYLYIKR